MQRAMQSRAHAPVTLPTELPRTKLVKRDDKWGQCSRTELEEIRSSGHKATRLKLPSGLLIDCDTRTSLIARDPLVRNRNGHGHRRKRSNVNTLTSFL